MERKAHHGHQSPRRPPHFFSLDEYFALEHVSDARYEYWDGEIVCMSGGSQAHTQISGNVFFRLRLQLGGKCRVFTADLPVKTPPLPPYRYPDVTVGCGELAFEHIRGVDALTNPTLIVEVLLPTTAARDYQDKFTAYQAIPSFTEYLLIAQETSHVTHYTRQPDGKWARSDVIDVDARLTLDCIGGTLSLREIYEDVTLNAI